MSMENHSEDRGAGQGRGPGQPGSGKPERYVQPSLLMALRAGPSYGYELLQRIGDYGFMRGAAPPGMIYRHLRQMEEEGLVASQWETEGGGPAKRVYTLTPEGGDMLRWWIGYMETQARLLTDFIRRYGETP